MPRKQKTASSPAKYRQSSLLDMFSSSPSILKRSSKGKGKRLPTDELSTDSDVAEVTCPPSKKKQRRTLSRFVKESESEGSDSSDVGRYKFEERTSSVHSVEEEGKEGDAGPSTQVRRAKRRRLLASDSEEKLVSDDDDADNRGVGLIRPRSSRSKKGQVIDSDSDVQPKVLTKRRLVKGVRPPSDEEDILDGIQKDKIIESRLRGKSSKQSRFMKNLERLKMKKRGEIVRSSDESEEEAHEDDPDAPIPGARPEWGEEEEEEDQYEDIDDFIIQDEGNVQVANLPAAFSMNTHQDLAHHFKIVCQYHVHLAVCGDRKKRKVSKRLAEDEYFSVPLAITRRKMADLQDTIASSVWRPAYKKALRKYPDFNLTELDFAIPQCDACHLGGRMSKFMGRLDGDPYDRTTFIPIQDSASSDSDADEEHLVRELHLGRWCAQRTEIFHELCHWELRLSENISREVKELMKVKRGSTKIIYSCKPPEDPGNGDEVMDWLDRREIITLEWTMVKTLITRATNLDSDVKRGKAVD